MPLSSSPMNSVRSLSENFRLSRLTILSTWAVLPSASGRARSSSFSGSQRAQADRHPLAVDRDVVGRALAVL
ncbi:hypothetical protein KQH60_12075 [Mycetohabitans sp. B8]|nr:hypothetical protein [Mycetohabitans sp. B8]